MDAQKMEHTIVFLAWELSKANRDIKKLETEKENMLTEIDRLGNNLNWYEQYVSDKQRMTPAQEHAYKKETL